MEARDRDRLEHLCRYAGRAAIAENRLSELPDGRVAYSLKKRWKDGTTHVVMTKQVLMERLCALVPRPRRHLVTYHGVFAPAAGIRRWVVPKVESEVALPASASGASAGLVAAAVRVVVGGGALQPGGASLQAELAESVRRSLSARTLGARRKRRTGPRRRYPWAELLRRVFLIEVLVCPRCGGPRRLLAAIQDPESIRKVLGSLGLSAEVPELAAARSPPRQVELEFEGSRGWGIRRRGPADGASGERSGMKAGNRAEWLGGARFARGVDGGGGAGDGAEVGSGRSGTLVVLPIPFIIV